MFRDTYGDHAPRNAPLRRLGFARSMFATLTRKASVLQLLGIASFGLLLVACGTPSRAQEPIERRPGNYLIWAGEEGAPCRTAMRFVNKLPNQDLASASRNMLSGLLRWHVGTRIPQEGPKAAFPFYPLNHLQLDLTGSGETRYVIRSTTMLNRVETQTLHVSSSLPTSAQQVDMLFTTEPAFSGYADSGIAKLQARHGERWQDWYIGAHVVITALEGQPPVFVASETLHDLRTSTKALVFLLGNAGQREDICVLRRICTCHSSCAETLGSNRERALLLPADKYCKKS